MSTTARLVAWLVDRSAPPFLAVSVLLVELLLAKAPRDLARHGKGMDVWAYRLPHQVWVWGECRACRGRSTHVLSYARGTAPFVDQVDRSSNAA